MFVSIPDLDIKKERVFVDLNGTQPGVTFWGLGQPDNTRKHICETKFQGQNCVMISFMLSSYWDDEWCCNQFKSACQENS